MIDISKLTPEWLAGFFDGEGCVCISVNGKSQALRVNITQADHDLLLAIKQRYGAGYGPARKGRRTKSGRGSVVYEISWSGNKCKDILELLSKHVVKKVAQVAIGLKFIDLMLPRGGNSRVTKKFSAGQFHSREALRQQLRDINHAGPGKPISLEHAGEEYVQ